MNLAVSRPPGSGQNPSTTGGSSPEPLAAAPPACAGCCDGPAASRLSRLDLRCGTPSTTETPDVAQAPKAGPPLQPAAASDPNPAAPPAAKVPHRSSAELSPPTPPGNPRGSVICNWQRGDILIRRLHIPFAFPVFWNMDR